MGGSHSLEDDLVEFRMTSKTMGRESKKAEKNEALQKKKLHKAIAEGNLDVAKLYAQNAIREKSSALQYLRLQSRIDAVSSRLQQAIAMKNVSGAMKSQVKGMANVLKSMEADKITQVMEDFEKQFEDMDVKSSYMESTMDSTTAMSTPADQVDELIRAVAAENKLELGESMGTVPTGTKTTEANTAVDPEVVSQQDRLAALRNRG
jgi:charged multivesicular body protein 1